MPVTIRAIGTIQALATVSVRSRVDGQIMKTAFTEGQTVAILGDGSTTRLAHERGGGAGGPGCAL